MEREHRPVYVVHSRLLPDKTVRATRLPRDYDTVEAAYEDAADMNARTYLLPQYARWPAIFKRAYARDGSLSRESEALLAEYLSNQLVDEHTDLGDAALPPGFYVFGGHRHLGMPKSMRGSKHALAKAARHAAAVVAPPKSAFKADAAVQMTHRSLMHSAAKIRDSAVRDRYENPLDEISSRARGRAKTFRNSRDLMPVAQTVAHAAHAVHRAEERSPYPDRDILARSHDLAVDGGSHLPPPVRTERGVRQILDAAFSQMV